MTGTYDEVMFEYQVDKPLIRVMGVPPEEMRLDRYARSLRDLAHRRPRAHRPDRRAHRHGLRRASSASITCRRQDIHNFTMESQLRNPGRYMSTRVGDGVLYGEWYIKVDRDGDGVAELRYICTMGEDHEIVHDEPANRIKFAVFGCDPISHTIVGDSHRRLHPGHPADQDQHDARRARQPRREHQPEDRDQRARHQYRRRPQRRRSARVIRTRGDPSDAVAFATTPFVGQQALPIIELLNDVLQRRTGLSDAAKGLDPKHCRARPRSASRRSSTASRSAPNSSPASWPKPASRIFSTASTTRSPSPRTSAGRCASTASGPPIDTSTFDASMGVEVNSTLGKGSDTVRMMTLQQIKHDQQMIMQQFGPGNPVVRHPGIPQHHHRHAGRSPTSRTSAATSRRRRPRRCSRSPAAPKEPDADDGRGQGPIREGQVGNRPGDGRPADQAAEAGTGRRLPPRAAQAENRLRPAEARNRTGQGVRRRRPRRPNRSRSDRGGQDRRRHPPGPSRRRDAGAQDAGR